MSSAKLGHSLVLIFVFLNASFGFTQVHRAAVECIEQQYQQRMGSTACHEIPDKIALWTQGVYRDCAALLADQRLMLMESGATQAEANTHIAGIQKQGALRTIDKTKSRIEDCKLEGQLFYDENHRQLRWRNK